MTSDPMRICFVVNDVDTEVSRAATTVIARAAAMAGHTVYMAGVADLSYHSPATVRAICRRAPEGGGENQEAFLEAVQGPQVERSVVSSSEMDVLYLRYNPMEEMEHRPWDHDTAMAFGQMASLQGVIVLSDPFTLPYANNKLYMEHFPESIRPRTVITRSYEEIVRFHADEKGKIVLKPLRGYGGKDVFLVDEDAANLKQIVESITRTTFVVAQEFIPEAADGDTRLFLFNGRPLVVEEKCAALRRVGRDGDFRSNLSAGGKAEKAVVTDRILEIARIVRPRLIADGLFDVGLDIVGDKLIEINAMSAGGLNAAGHLEGVDFGAEVVRLIERKLQYRRENGNEIPNRLLATLD
jgi:glutathione synthase